MSKCKYGITYLPVLTATLLSGCSESTEGSLYDTYYTGTGDYAGPGIDTFTNAMLNAYTYLRGWIVLMIIISELLGLMLLLAFSKRNKKIKKTAIFCFMLGLPIMFLLIFFIMAFWLNSRLYG